MNTTLFGCMSSFNICSKSSIARPRPCCARAAIMEFQDTKSTCNIVRNTRFAASTTPHLAYIVISAFPAPRLESCPKEINKAWSWRPCSNAPSTAQEVIAPENMY
ncbi:LOW QUALITY PROTEIN: hypothetical protein TorRG33x02_040020 [Trema orientale]|uniref:Uncharacterized protein n=1 Tax=Trema orientale TaxID=63057 RepID=A0A2P5FR38_TREOI|nr:LOW QUALITY PROTEIN: hypothetical protein TorRG33x02_040020 [Trema orientale]